ncbi:hypothetical protein [Leisingera sp. NJS204]|uniref:hypothetical protein n=1 Tax=Leisingera sp. NJS204 TaxID=2508307 RepID=UPI001011C09C|nr:hypothetical protein [Leisingera sp. NJS204]QAX31319.1 hypothetical protein ETW24_19115 [Leisingera sp. NJS204]
MPFNASGVFQRLFNWRNDRDAGVKILAERMDQEMDGFATALNDLVQGNVAHKGPIKTPFGTAAAPAYAFDGDPDTGFYRNAANEIGVSVGGSRKLRLAGDAFQIDAPVTGASVQSTPLDTAAGKLLLVGAFGLGANSTSAPPSNDISDGIPSGLYTTDADTTGTGSETPVNGPLLHVQRGGGTGSPGAFQIWQRGVGNLLYRRFASGVPTDWAEFFTSANILGTVSQSGGTPTGAVIERGSNANGEYVRFADGTQICTETVAPSTTAADSAWAFPAAFTTATGLVVVGGGRTNSDATFVSVRPPTTSTVDFSHWNTSGSRVGGAVSLTAIGRWF